MKRYMLFWGDEYDVGAGMYDFHNSYDVYTEALKKAKELEIFKQTYVVIYDIVEMKDMYYN